MFLNAPVVVLPPSSAAPDMLDMAARKSSVVMVPAAPILYTSSVVTPSFSDSSVTIGIPASPSWANTSPWTFPLVATLLKMDPMDCISTPAMVAASPTRRR